MTKQEERAARATCEAYLGSPTLSEASWRKRLDADDRARWLTAARTGAAVLNEGMPKYDRVALIAQMAATIASGCSSHPQYDGTVEPREWVKTAREILAEAERQESGKQ